MLMLQLVVGVAEPLMVTLLFLQIEAIGINDDVDAMRGTTSFLRQCLMSKKVGIGWLGGGGIGYHNTCWKVCFCWDCSFV